MIHQVLDKYSNLFLSSAERERERESRSSLCLKMATQREEYINCMLRHRGYIAIRYAVQMNDCMVLFIGAI